MGELSDAIKDYEDEDKKAIETDLEREYWEEEAGDPEKQDSIKPQSNKQEEQLLIDMKKLVGMDEKITNIHLNGQVLQRRIDTWAQGQGYLERLETMGDEKADLQKQYNLLKTDIGKRAEENYEKTKNVDPCLGVKVTMKKNRELILDREAAVRWAVEKEHLTLLDIFDDSYADLIETGVFPDQPGQVDTKPIPKARISLKPFQKEED